MRFFHRFGLISMSFGLVGTCAFAAQSKEALRQVAQDRLKEAQDAKSMAADRSMPSSERIRRMIRLLRREVIDPAPNVAQNIDTSTQMSESIQLLVMKALSKVGDLEALEGQMAEETDPRVRSLIALAGASTTATKSNKRHARFVEDVIQLLQNGRTVFLRATAARVLMVSIPSQPELRSRAVKALSAALEDPDHHKNRWGYEEYPVRGDAAGALAKLGVPIIRRTDGNWEVTGPDPLVPIGK